MLPRVRDRELAPRVRVLALRDRVDALRGDFDAPLLLPARFDGPADDFLRVDAAFRPLLVRVLALRDDLARVPDERVPLDVFERDPADFFRVEPPREDDAPELVLLLEDTVGFHFPDITRVAASATASAMIDPSLVALATTLLAACDAVSAASRPASRIFLRAAGLALIAAAAAARPAASISLLIAAFVSLSTVVSPACERVDDDPERELAEFVREEPLRVDLAIAYLPPSRKRHFKAVPVPE